MNKKIFFPVFMICLPLANQAQGQPSAIIQWGSNAFASNTDSQGLPLTNDFTFELGSFNLGFQATDPSTWASAWQPVDRTSYQDHGQFFQKTTTLTSSNQPDIPSNQPYIWGYRASEGIGEWILFTNPSWSWPALSELSFPEPTRWFLHQATSVHTGTIDTEYGTWSTNSSDKTSPPLTWKAWKELYFTNPEEISPDSDPDGDLLNNRLEYFLGTHPLNYSKNSPLEIVIEDHSTSPILCLILNRSPSAQGINASILHSANLSQWSKLSGFSIREESPYRLELIKPLSQPTSGFYQLQLDDLE